MNRRAGRQSVSSGGGGGEPTSPTSPSSPFSPATAKSPTSAGGGGGGGGGGKNGDKNVVDVDGRPDGVCEFCFFRQQWQSGHRTQVKTSYTAYDAAAAVVLVCRVFSVFF